MKTAMQELIEWCNSCLTDKTISHGGRIALEVTIVRATDLIEKEKEQIIDAMERTAMYVSVASIDKEIGKMTIEDLYNQTYNNEKD